MIGIGSGDSAAYTIGAKPASLAELREYALAIRSLMTTGRAEYHGRTATFTWSRVRVPIYLAASGPRTLRLAGQIADGAVIRTGLTPEIVRDSIAQVHAGAREAGRDPAEIDLWWWPDVNVGASYAEAVEEIKTSLAMAGNHLTRFTTEGKHVPPDLLPKMATLAERYVFGEHARPGSANCRLITELGLVDYLADRFAIVGTPADCVKKLERTIEAGARQFWMSIHFDDKFRLLRDFAGAGHPSRFARAARRIQGRHAANRRSAVHRPRRQRRPTSRAPSAWCARRPRAGPGSPACPSCSTRMYFCVETKPEYFDWAEPVPGPTTERMGALARELGIVLIAPVFEKAPDGRYFNCRGRARARRQVHRQVPQVEHPLHGRLQKLGAPRQREVLLHPGRPRLPHLRHALRPHRDPDLLRPPFPRGRARARPRRGGDRLRAHRHHPHDPLPLGRGAPGARHRQLRTTCAASTRWAWTSGVRSATTTATA